MPYAVVSPYSKVTVVLALFALTVPFKVALVEVTLPAATVDAVGAASAGAVSGNTAVTTPEPAAFVAAAPATLKKSADTPVSV
jgi:hypothetical protein